MKRIRNTHDMVFELCLSGMLAAMSVVIGALAKTIFGTGPLRLTFENLPVIFGAITLGPIWGTGIAVAADLTSCLIAGQAPLPLISIGAASIGLISGILGRFVFKKKSFLDILIIEAAAQAVGSVIIKSLALYQVGYTLPALLPRIPIYICVSALEAYLIYMLIRNPQIKKYCKDCGMTVETKQIEKNEKEGKEK